MRDVVIPGALQDAMSREAQAAREKQARIILGQAEMEIAHSFAGGGASRTSDNPTALHLRAMNMLYEGLKEKGALMLDPEQRRRVDGHGRPDGRRRAAAAAATARGSGQSGTDVATGGSNGEPCATWRQSNVAIARTVRRYPRPRASTCGWRIAASDRDDDGVRRLLVSSAVSRCGNGGRVVIVASGR